MKSSCRYLLSAWRILCAVLFLTAFTKEMRADGFAPSEAVKHMKLPEGFRAELVASEPDIAQPVCIEFDDRGRLWVIQYLQYPNPAGLQRVKVDRFSRTKYDKIPEPPPRGPKGADRITILSDFDEHHHARKTKDFVNGLNLTSGLAFGHGGVFVLQIPYLLFYPDKNGDDVPDSDPEVLLSGFGMEDAHSVANSLTWGPDGWLYGCQGSTVTANIRGIEFQQGVWRYHPLTKRFELFCEGGGNSWGLDFDEDGNLIYSTNLGPYRNLHGVQGGYYWKSFGKHGALHNPYTYGYFDHIPYKNFTGGHVTDGGIVYQGDMFPEKFRGKYIANDLLGHAVQWHNMEKSGSTFTASYGGELLTPNDAWFDPSDLTMGPDGSLYVADWFDKRTAHPDPDADWDKSNGRIYRISFESKGVGTATSPQKPNEKASGGKTLPAPEELAKLSSDKLVDLLSDRNDWYVRKARRILADRRDVTVYPRLRAQVFEAKAQHLALESFWALYVSGGADESFLNDVLNHPSAKLRFWAVQLLGDAEKISPTSTEHLIQVAGKEPDVRVRSQLASTAQRLPAADGLRVAHKVASQDIDARDAYIPLLLWWAVEKFSVANVDEVLDLFCIKAGESSIIHQTILPRLMRRWAAEGNSRTLAGCAYLLKAKSANEKARGEMLNALEQGFREQQKPLSKLDALPGELQKQLTTWWDEQSNNQTLQRLLAHLAFEPAKQHAFAVAEDQAASTDRRVAALQLIGELADPAAMHVLLGLTVGNQPEPVLLAALDALQQIPNAEIRGVLANYPKMSSRVRSKVRDVLFSRKAWAEAFLRGVDSGGYAKDEVALDQLQKIATFDDKDLNELVRKHWGNIGRGTPEEKLADIRRFNNDLRAFAGDAKAGHQVFLKTCSPCHELFGEGEKVGPELTHANRGDKDFLLTSIVDPSAVIRKEFLNYNIETSDGRVLNGLIAEQNANSVTVVAAKNERTTIPRDKIVSLQESSISLMPEGLLHALTPQERRDLFAYLQSEKPPQVKKASAEKGLERIKVAGAKFIGAESGKEFTPIGFNYDRDFKSRLIEDYWNAEWQTVTEDFAEMKRLGANVVRVHLQFGKFMDSPKKPKRLALERLTKLLTVAEQTGLYLDLTGLACYRKADVPVWFDALSESERWAAQANFWKAVAECGAKSSAIFCYDLMNEPIFPAEKSKEWLTGELSGFFYVQFVTRDPAGRSRSEIARQWIAKLSEAIRQEDKQTMITVGLLPFEPREFVSEIAPQLDYVSVHLYPKAGKVGDELQTLSKFAIGKPVVIEETYPLSCSIPELSDFLKRSRANAAGWISFYWGQTPEELRATSRMSDALLREWLVQFQKLQPSLTLSNR